MRTRLVPSTFGRLSPSDTMVGLHGTADPMGEQSMKAQGWALPPLPAQRSSQGAPPTLKTTMCIFPQGKTAALAGLLQNSAPKTVSERSHASC